jgi:hypothetical protein
MSGGKGGSQTTQVEIPKYIEDASRANIAQGKEISQIGYTPYYGPDVAAFTPMQAAAMQSAANFGSAFGLMPQMDAMAGMPEAQTFEGGLRGYSSAPLYEQAVAELAARRPAQAALINQQFIDPYGSAESVNAAYNPSEFNVNAYMNAPGNKDILQDYYANRDALIAGGDPAFRTPEGFARRHYETTGRFENRPLG